MLTRKGWKPPRVDLSVPSNIVCDGWVSDMTSALHLAGILPWRAPDCPWEALWADGLQLPCVAGRPAQSFSGETCDPRVGKNDFFS